MGGKSSSFAGCQAHGLDCRDRIPISHYTSKHLSTEAYIDVPWGDALRPNHELVGLSILAVGALDCQLFAIWSCFLERPRPASLQQKGSQNMPTHTTYCTIRSRCSTRPTHKQCSSSWSSVSMQSTTSPRISRSCVVYQSPSDPSALLQHSTMPPAPHLYKIVLESWRLALSEPLKRCQKNVKKCRYDFWRSLPSARIVEKCRNLSWHSSQFFRWGGPVLQSLCPGRSVNKI